MAVGVLRALLRESGLGERVLVDSAGIHARVGSPPDDKAVAAVAARGIDISLLRARLFQLSDFIDHDLILAMDHDNHSYLSFLCPPPHQHKLKLLMTYAAGTRDVEVPDPYGGNMRRFKRALEQIEQACHGLLAIVQGQNSVSWRH